LKYVTKGRSLVDLFISTNSPSLLPNNDHIVCIIHHW
jgi:hypothetical protein